MYILILTIFAITSQGGSAIEGTAGYTSEAACMAAASKWLEENKRVDPNRDYYITAICSKS